MENKDEKWFDGMWIDFYRFLCEIDRLLKS